MFLFSSLCFFLKEKKCNSSTTKRRKRSSKSSFYNLRFPIEWSKANNGTQFHSERWNTHTKLTSSFKSEIISQPSAFIHDDCLKVTKTITFLSKQFEIISLQSDWIERGKNIQFQLHWLILARKNAFAFKLITQLRINNGNRPVSSCHTCY